MTAYTLPWGKNGKLQMQLPKNWNIIDEIIPSMPTPVKSVQEEVIRAINDPIGQNRLSDLLKNGKKILFVVEDISRPSPINLILQPIYDLIVKSGINTQNMTILNALGVHRSMNQDDMEKKVGKEIIQKIKWENHDCRNPEMLDQYGTTSRGTPIYLNKLIKNSDVVILLGTIEPHVQAGFGGGFKNIVPGVAGVETIGINHQLVGTPEYFWSVGSNPEQNPMRLDIEEIGNKIQKEIFIINAVLDLNLRLIKIFAGDPIKAHREGIKLATKIYGKKIPKQADIIITNSHPMDIDLRQGVKCIANTLFAVKEEGTIIGTMKCDEGLGNLQIPRFNVSFSEFRKLLKTFKEKDISKFFNKMKINVEDKFNAYFIMKAVSRNNIYLFSENLGQYMKELPTFELFSDLNALINRVQTEIKIDPDVLIFPYGGVSYPILPH